MEDLKISADMGTAGLNNQEKINTDWAELFSRDVTYPQPTSSVCPHCGYCPHCGRNRGYYPNYPSYPYYPFNGDTRIWC